MSKFGNIVSKLYAVQFTCTVWNVSKYGVFSGPYFPVLSLNGGKYGPEKTPYLDTFHAICLPFGTGWGLDELRTSLLDVFQILNCTSCRCVWKLHVCLSIYDLLTDTRRQRVNEISVHDIQYHRKLKHSCNVDKKQRSKTFFLSIKLYIWCTHDFILANV